MATLQNVGSINFTASTWAVIDATSLSTSEAAATTLSTSYSVSAAFTPGAITIAGIAIKVSSRPGTTGTLDWQLYNNTGAAAVTGTDCSINVSLLSTAHVGWVYYKFASSVLLLAATSYSVRVKASSATQVAVYRTATANDWSRALITTTTATPSASDQIFIMGEYTSTTNLNSFTVTNNNTATTIWGNTRIGAGGIFNWGTTASTAYYYKLAGDLEVGAQGALQIGTSGTPMPSSSSGTLYFDCASAVQYGLLLRPGSTFYHYGNAITYTNTTLAADLAAAGTSATTAVSTGWASGDEVVFGSTSQTATQNDLKALSGAASGTTISWSGGITNAHSGTSPYIGTVINLTRNIVIRGASTTNTAYVASTTTAGLPTWSGNYTSFMNLGSATAGKRGIDTNNIGTLDMQNCVIRDGGTSAFALSLGTTAANITFTNNICYNINTGPVCVATTASAITFTNNLILGCTTGLSISDEAVDWSNCKVVGTTTGVSVSGNYATTSVPISNVTINSCATGISSALVGDGGALNTWSNFTIWRCSSFGMNYSATSGLVFDGWNVYANVVGIRNQGGVGCFLTYKNCTFNGGTSPVQPEGLRFLTGSGAYNITLDTCTFGATSTHGTGDINFLSGSMSAQITARNCTFASSTEVAGQSFLTVDSYVRSSKHDQTTGSHKKYMHSGIITSDTSIFAAASPSQRLTPNQTDHRLPSSSKIVAAASGQTITINVKVRESVVGDGTDYNGNRIRLWVKANPACSAYTSDTLLATATVASEGAFETLTATTSALTDDGALEFYCDANGTTGWANIDDWSVT